jgi:23S rRNA (guanosine2251-2'-O)-methyltransferase
MKLNSKQLRITKPTEEELANIKRKQLWIIADNVLDTYNIGGLFRLADAVAAKELILCGGSETPPSSRIHKAAVGTEEWVSWRYFAGAAEAIKRLRDEVSGIKIVAVEQSEKSVPLFSPDIPHLNPSPILGEGNFIDTDPVAVVIGHETDGVTKEALDLADVIVEIPMWGVNKSLNVIVSAAIAVYGMLKTN